MVVLSSDAVRCLLCNGLFRWLLPVLLCLLPLLMAKREAQIQ